MKQYATSATPTVAKTNDSVTPRPMIAAAPVPSSAIAPTGPISPTEKAAASTTFSSLCMVCPDCEFSIAGSYPLRALFASP
jgi:hypothetical protein